MAIEARRLGGGPAPIAGASLYTPGAGKRATITHLDIVETGGRQQRFSVGIGGGDISQRIMEQYFINASQGIQFHTGLVLHSGEGLFWFADGAFDSFNIDSLNRSSNNGSLSDADDIYADLGRTVFSTQLSFSNYNPYFHYHQQGQTAQIYLRRAADNGYDLVYSQPMGGNIYFADIKVNLNPNVGYNQIRFFNTPQVNQGMHGVTGFNIQFAKAQATTQFDVTVYGTEVDV